MTIRSRLTLWYAGILIVSLIIMGVGTYLQIAEQVERSKEHYPIENPLEETGELILQAGLPAVILGLLGGWWLTRRALIPVNTLANAAERIHDGNLREPLPRSGNGDEIDKLAGVFNESLVRLDDSFKRIREFTLHASHELKTPLTILRGEIETALHGEELSPGERDRAGSQMEELVRLTHIVDSLTLLAKADAGQVALQLEPLRLDELVRDSFADLQILAESHDISVELETCEEISIRGDRHRLRQVLLNLADNAVKYNEPKGKVKMKLRRANDFAEFTISNTGPGIPAERLPHVFDRFFRGDASHNRAIDGCGLGLSIAQWIVSAHAGTIQISSVPQQETTVRAQLPLPPAGKPA